MESLNGFSSAEIESLGALSTTFFPSLPVAASGLVLDEQSKLEVYEFYRASTPDGCSPSKVSLFITYVCFFLNSNELLLILCAVGIH